MKFFSLASMGWPRTVALGLARLALFAIRRTSGASGVEPHSLDFSKAAASQEIFHLRRYVMPIMVVTCLMWSGWSSAQSRFIWNEDLRVVFDFQNPTFNNGFRLRLGPASATATSFIENPNCQQRDVYERADFIVTTDPPPPYFSPQVQWSGNFRPGDPPLKGIYANIDGICGVNALAQRSTLDFSRPLDARGFQMHFINSDAARYDFSLSPGSPRLTRRAGNDRFAVSGSVANTSPIVAVLRNCQGNDGSNPSGACGSISFSGATITRLVWENTDIDTLRGGGDGHFIFFSLQQPSLLIKKTTFGGTGANSFSFSYPDNVASAQAVSTPATREIISVSANNAAVNGAQRYIVDTLRDTVISETVPTGWVVSGTCKDLSAGGSVVGTIAPDGSVTIPAARIQPASQIECGFVNSRGSGIQLQKALPNGRISAGDQFALTIGGPGSPVNTTTTGAGTQVVGSASIVATPGSAYTLAEAGATGTNIANYQSAYACTNSRPGGQTPSGTGTSFTITPVQGDEFACTFTNSAAAVDLSVSKTANPSSVRTGEVVTYTVTATNGGPSPANNAVLRDEPGAGLDCNAAGLPAPTCTASGGASCPAPLIASVLTGGGLPIPVFPIGGSVAVTLACSVTATGTP